MKLNFKYFILSSILLLAWLTCPAQTNPFEFFGFGNIPTVKQEKKVKFAYDVYFSLDFDNMEFAHSEGRYTSSGTLFSAQLTPTIGLDARQNENISHHVRGGVDIIKNFGESPVLPGQEKLLNLGLFREITIWYNLKAKTGNTTIEAYAGILPRRFIQGDYSYAQFSDSLRIKDKNLEGALITIRRPRSIYEFGCDWMGMKGPGRRERFMLFTYGESFLASFFSLGWSITGYHYAGAAGYGHVADNIIAEPFVKFDLSGKTGLQELSAKISFLAGLQRLRDVSMDFSVPLGGELRLGVKNWNVGLENRTYVGTSQMPFYNNIDDGGFKFGSDLYWGDPMYRVHYSSDTPWNSVGWYNRAEIYYMPRIAYFLDLRLGMVFHMTGDADKPFAFAGWQQKLSLVFSLDKLLGGAPKSPKVKKKSQNFSDFL